MSIKIIQAGLFSTIQDIGRIGYQHIGFSGAGAMDVNSFRLAQIMIGNEGPAIEYTMIGPTIQFNEANTFVLCGAYGDSLLNNQAISHQTVYFVDKGDILTIGPLSHGTRGYITFGKPLDIPKVANSYSTHTRTAIGGYKGRTLQKNDMINVRHNNKYKINLGKHADMNLLPQDKLIHIIEGPQINEFSTKTIETLTQQSYVISEQSDRMGYRLIGEGVAPINNADIISEPVALGSIQVPNDGQPIILLNDKQTIGGYTKIATVCKFDLPKLAQMKPNDDIKFKWLDFEVAKKINDKLENDFEINIKTMKDKPTYDMTALRQTSQKISKMLQGAN
ncbi:5-oxoprolinase subunit C family protein [Staphylococcus simiae]|uniref:Allophanate hydrolase n=1 Tax=Staphylococcus simiae CCM 7213 = CCUG 51256 TaxID=911238 RepID=G5JM94_9STAP|nr:biotin-dependent carboxyltransferase family protein [Staphylococcus simiae]EHJ06690.1 allophanate hydrolase [Staphylococcus simiae CCM 7213 = CCUG 51256]PNZ14392.1 allophanate hydrolase [Staphylococcus simiae]SNV73592.1 allophanate hydrolase subunit 2 [Staphylococcus simiae]